MAGIGTEAEVSPWPGSRHILRFRVQALEFPMSGMGRPLNKAVVLLIGIVCAGALTAILFRPHVDPITLIGAASLVLPLWLAEGFPAIGDFVVAHRFATGLCGMGIIVVTTTLVLFVKPWENPNEASEILSFFDGVVVCALVLGISVTMTAAFVVRRSK